MARARVSVGTAQVFARSKVGTAVHILCLRHRMRPKPQRLQKPISSFERHLSDLAKGGVEHPQRSIAAVDQRRHSRVLWKERRWIVIDRAGRWIENAECEVRRYAEEFEVPFMFFRAYWPGMEPEQALEAIRLFGQEVIPQLRR